MSSHPMRRRMTAFTLVELMIVVALVGVILALAAPSFRDMILMQRLRGVNAQIVTDMQYARSEAISRGTYVHVKFQATAGAGGMSCYIIFTRPDTSTFPSCDCTAGAAARCPPPPPAAALSEVRTVQVTNAQSVFVAAPLGEPLEYIIDPRTGGIVVIPVDSSYSVPGEFNVDAYIDSPRRLRNHVGLSGRPSVCKPSGSIIAGGAC